MNSLIDNDDYLASALDRVQHGVDRKIRRRASRARWGVSVGSFAVAGVLAGTLTAGALATSSADDNLESYMAHVALSYTYDGPLVGEPTFTRGSGPQDLTVPPKSEGANALLVSVQCVAGAPASLVAHDGTQLMTSTCGDGNDDQVHQYVPPESPPTAVSISGDGSWAVWISWYTYPPDAAPSAAQKAALADGSVTRDEYEAGYLRALGCMGQAGFDMIPVPLNELVLHAGTSGAEDPTWSHSCYPREFKQIDSVWQLEIEKAATACLARIGVTPAHDGTEWDDQLSQHGLTPQECGLQQ